MKQYEAVIEVMKANGGYATLGHLNRTALNVPGVKWRTKTPFASIRRIVQDERFFFKIRPGLWALKEWRERIPFPLTAQAEGPKREFTHTYYQGLLVEVGNVKKYGTFVPSQDKNRKYLEKPLSQIATLKRFYEFGYERFLRRARTIDVTWFNDRKMPCSFFEVEHSTNIQNSLVKFVELQDFACGFVIVADRLREKQFRDVLTYAAFQPIADRVSFMDYEALSQVHSRAFALSTLELSCIANHHVF